MESAPHPDSEAERLAALAEFEILDTDPEPEFDAITSLVAEICEVPIALVSLIDERRQWFKSAVGLDATETGRDEAFCAHAISQPERILEVPDAREDRRFRDNPLVVGDPGVRFYAGAPVVTADGHALGTLCVIDRRRRELDPLQRRLLGVAAQQVSTLLELRRTNLELRREATRRGELLGRLRRRNEDLDEFARTVAHDLRAPLRGVRSLVERIAEEAPRDLSAPVRERLDQIGDRVVALDGLVERLWHYAVVGRERAQFERLRLGEVVRDVVEQLDLPDNVEVELGELPIVELPRAPIELVVRNLVSNAVNHHDRPDPHIAISAVREDGGIVLRVADDGPGIPAEDRERVLAAGHSGSTEAGHGVGLALVDQAVAALGGSLSVEADADRGATIRVFLPRG